jgi:tetratricopeptide (TPR) repeat protein
VSIDSHKPRLIFFQNRYDDNLPDFLLAHKREHVNCLSMFFDVTVIQHDCDYEQICDQYRPDLALFESGVNLLTCRKPKIANVRSCRIIPKLGLFNADAWCETRAGSLSEMEQWGIETFFSICTTAAEHMPGIADHLFIWPNSIDATVYYNYNIAKNIPVLLSGATAAQYPWRRRVYRLVAEHYPSLWCPHRGYLSRSSAGQVLSGVSYAMTISAAKVAPVCGTVAKEVIRKHFEIPACNTCLITERARNLEEAGFIDLVNCVFADEHDILDKLEYLFVNPERLREITEAGHRLVHKRHTHQNRNQILQWFRLNQTIDPGQKIIQPNPFANLMTTSSASPEDRPQAIVVGTHLQLLRKGDEMLWAGQVQSAESKYERCLSYMQKFPEARFKLALCDLHKGNSARANSRIFELIQYSISEYQAVDPDPVEWAYYLVSLLAMGKLVEAKTFASEFSWLQHPELSRVRLAIHVLFGAKPGEKSTVRSGDRYRHSIHELPEKSETAWYEQLIQIMRACGQSSLIKADMFNQKFESLEKRSNDLIKSSLRVGWSNESLKESNAILSTVTTEPSRSKQLEQKLNYFKARRKLKKWGTRATHLMGQIRSYLYPTPPNPKVDAQLSETIRELARDLEFESVLIIGGKAIDGVAETIKNGMIGADKSPLFCCLYDKTDRLTFDGQTASTHETIRRNPAAVQVSQEGFVVDLENALWRFKRDNIVAHFDAAIVAWPERDHRVVLEGRIGEEIANSRLIVFVDLQSENHREIYSRLLVHDTHVMLSETTARGNYVVFTKKNAVKWEGSKFTEHSSSQV